MTPEQIATSEADCLAAVVAQAEIYQRVIRLAPPGVILALAGLGLMYFTDWLPATSAGLWVVGVALLWRVLDLIIQAKWIDQARRLTEIIRHYEGTKS